MQMDRTSSEGFQQRFGSDLSLVMAAQQASWYPSSFEYRFDNIGLQENIRRDESLAVPVRRAFLSPITSFSIRPKCDCETEQACIDHKEKMLPRSLPCCSSEDLNRGAWTGSETEVVLPQYDYKKDSCIGQFNEKVASTRSSSLCSYSEGHTIRHGKRDGYGVAKKYVRFVPKRSNSTAIIMSLDDYTAKEHHSCWYSQEELDTMLNRSMRPLHRDARWNAGATLDHMYDSKMWSGALRRPKRGETKNQ